MLSMNYIEEKNENLIRQLKRLFFSDKKCQIPIEK